MKLFENSPDRPAKRHGLDYSSSARTDVRFYALLLGGVVFTYAGATIDPATNCSEGGECAPWLVPIAFVMGVMAMLAGLANLSANPKRGSRIDEQARQLVWWNEHRLPGLHTLSVDDIAKVRVRKGSDEDSVFLIGHDGKALPFPPDDVVPWPYEDWARALAARFPHIETEIAG